jgi:O-antigen/teichoic acid export membrane protein
MESSAVNGTHDGISGEILRPALEFVRTSPTLKNTFWLGSASVVNGLLGAVSSAVLGRALGVKEFGTFTLMLTLIGLMTDLGDLGLTSTFVRFGSASVAEKNQGRFRDVVAVILRMKIALTVIILLVSVFFLRRMIPLLFGHVDQQLSGYFGLALATVLLGIAVGIFYPIFQSYQDFRTHALLTVARAGTKLLLLLALVGLLVRLTVLYALWVELAAVVLFLLLSYGRSPFRKFTLRVENGDVQRAMLAFNRWILIAQILSVISLRLDIFFVGGMLDSGSLGLYGAAGKIAALVVTVVNSYYAVLIAGVSASSGEELMRKVRNAWKAVGAMIAGVMLLALLSEALVLILYGHNFDASGMLLRLMCIGLAFTVLAYPLNAVLFARNFSGVFAAMAVASLGAVVVGNLLLIPRYGATGAALAYGLNALASFLVSASAYLFLRKRLKSAPA